MGRYCPPFGALARTRSRRGAARRQAGGRAGRGVVVLVEEHHPHTRFDGQRRHPPGEGVAGRPVVGHGRVAAQAEEPEAEVAELDDPDGARLRRTGGRLRSPLLVPMSVPGEQNLHHLMASSTP